MLKHDCIINSNASTTLEPNFVFIINYAFLFREILNWDVEYKTLKTSKSIDEFKIYILHKLYVLWSFKAKLLISYYAFVILMLQWLNSHYYDIMLLQITAEW